MKKIFISIVIILSVTGCWNYKELNDYSIVTGIAIDKADDKYEISVLISNASKNDDTTQSSQSKIVVHTGKGDTIFKAFKDIGLINPKELYLGHFSVLIISEDIAKEGIYNVIDLFLRESSAKKDFNVVIARNCKAKDTLKIITPLTDFPSQNISENLISTTQLQSIISNVNFNELISKLINSGINPVINSIEIIGNIEEGSSKDNTESSEPKAYTKLSSLGIFKKDKLTEWATYDESIGINIINNKVMEMYLKVSYKDGYVVFDTTQFSTDVKVSLKDNTPIVNISSKGEAKIMEVDGKINLDDDKVMEELKKQSNIEIKRYIKQAIELALKSKSDIFGLGLKFNQNYPSYYKKVKSDWDNNLEKIKFNIKSNIIIKTKGSSQNSLEVRND